MASSRRCDLQLHLCWIDAMLYCEYLKELGTKAIRCYIVYTIHSHVLGLECTIKSYEAKWRIKVHKMEVIGPKSKRKKKKHSFTYSSEVLTSETCLQHFVDVGKSAKFPRAVK
ncbi:hypothetical protein F2Q69_00015642 [Brassica cretica]|uniref:Uncharacterized protein n=1 Tax=Brassica cretica TaxID=69181 RepID=A0A8S9QZA7_BRACR|nr:hypothetical protein F2Q69_00015642 [Brassica cretica]